jgi:hypothetical protein
MARGDEQGDQPQAGSSLWVFFRSTRGMVLLVSTFVGAAVVGATVILLIQHLFNDPVAPPPTDPVEVVAEANVDKFDANGPSLERSYVIPKRIYDIGAPPGDAGQCRGRYAWAHALGGVDADGSGVRVVVKRQHASTVILTGLHPRVVKAEPPVIGSHISCPPARGDSLAGVRSFRVVLTSSGAPTSQYIPLESDASKSFRLEVPQNEAVVFYITARAIDCYCLWVADLDLIIDGYHQTVTITGEGGKPFGVTSPVAAEEYQWRDGRWVGTSTRPGRGAPPMAGIPVPALGACNLVMEAEVEQLFVHSTSKSEGVGFRVKQRPAAQRTLESLCVHVIQQPGERFYPRLLIVYSVARNPADGKAAFRLNKTRLASRQTELHGPGDEAFAVDYAAYMRKGAQTISMSLMTKRPANDVNKSIRLLAELAAERAWG